MSTYNQYGQNSESGNSTEVSQEEVIISEDGVARNSKGQKMIRVDGFKQVLEMLQVADSDFRNSLMARIARQDPELAAQLRLGLGI